MAIDPDVQKIINQLNIRIDAVEALISSFHTPEPPKPPEPSDVPTAIRDFLTTKMPVSSTWNLNGWHPTKQVEMIEAGYFMLPTLKLMMTNSGQNSQKAVDQYFSDHAEALAKIRDWGLPIVLRTHNVASPLYKTGSAYRQGAPMEQTATTWRYTDEELTILDSIPSADAFGPVENYESLANDYTGEPGAVQPGFWIPAYMAFFPDAPTVIMLTNNEDSKTRFNRGFFTKGNMSGVLKSDVEMQMENIRYFQWVQEFRATEGRDPTTTEAYLKVEGNWNTLFGALFDRIKSNVSGVWSDFRVGAYTGNNVTTIAPQVRLSGSGDNKPFVWQDWEPFSTFGYSPKFQRFDMHSPATAYMNYWEGYYDDTLRTPQYRSQNLRTIHREQGLQNPKWLLEVSAWYGYSKSSNVLLKKFGEIYNLDRAKGYLRMMLWMSRIKGQPFSYRAFYSSAKKPDDPVLSDEEIALRPPGTHNYTNGEAFSVLCDVVREVHENDTLRQFWLEGDLLYHEAHPPTVTKTHTRENSPWQNNFWWHVYPDGVVDDRFCQLVIDKNPPQSEWGDGGRDIDIDAFAIALKILPNRYMMYAWSPVDVGVTGATVTIPGYGDVTEDLRQTGDFFYYDKQ